MTNAILREPYPSRILLNSCADSTLLALCHADLLSSVLFLRESTLLIVGWIFSWQSYGKLWRVRSFSWLVEHSDNTKWNSPRSMQRISYNLPIWTHIETTRQTPLWTSKM